jgi:hypothetical protein
MRQIFEDEWSIILFRVEGGSDMDDDGDENGGDNDDQEHGMEMGWRSSSITLYQTPRLQKEKVKENH